MNTTSEEVKRLEEWQSSLERLIKAEQAVLDTRKVELEKCRSQLARQRLEQEPQGAEKYVKCEKDGVFIRGTTATACLHPQEDKQTSLQIVGQIIAEQRQAQDQQSREHERRLEQLRIAKALKKKVSYYFDIELDPERAATLLDVVEWLRQGCPQPKDAEPATIDPPQSPYDRCVCGHIRVSHEKKGGILACTVEACACGPGCIHEGFVRADGLIDASMNLPETEPRTYTATEADLVTESPQPQRMTAREIRDKWWHSHGQSVEPFIQLALDQPPDAATKERIVREWVNDLTRPAIVNSIYQWGKHSSMDDAQAFKDSLLASLNQTVTT